MKHPHMQAEIQEIKAAQRPIWKRVAADLEKPTRQRRAVNVFKIETNTKDGDVVVIPGKVLGEGTLTKKITVAAHSFSDVAREKINATGKAITLTELMKENPEGKKVKILG